MSVNTPNFLFLFPDQWRWDWVGYKGTIPVQTPHLDALANRGLQFTNARTTTPLCGPSRACLASGLHFHRAGVLDNNDELNPALPNLYKKLSAAGYHVITTGKSDLHTASEHFEKSGWHPYLTKLGFTEGADFPGKWRGVKRMLDQLPDAYSTFLQDSGQMEIYLQDMKKRDEQRRKQKNNRHCSDPSPLPEHCHIDAFCGAESLRLLEQVPTGQPWFLTANFPGPHEPFDPPAHYSFAYADTPFPQPVNGIPEDTADYLAIQRNYAAMITHIDDWIGRLVDAVTHRGESENTWIIFASDHGELLGDHGLWYKQSPYEASVRIPLLISGHRDAPCTKTHALVEHIDIHATIVELAGLTPSAQIDARSLVPILADPASNHRSHTLSALRNWRMVTDGSYKFTEWKDGRMNLWNLREDPDELKDLSMYQQFDTVKLELQEILSRKSPWVTVPHGYRPLP